MKKIYFILFAVLLTSFVFGQKTTTRALNSFKELTIIGNFPVEIVRSNENKVEIKQQSDQVNLENLIFTYKKNSLTIKYQGSFVDDIDLHLIVYYAAPISLIDARRGVEIRMHDAGNYDDPVSYNADSGSKVLIEHITAPKIDAKITKGGSIRITGKATVLNTTVKAGGTIGVVNLKADEVNAKVLAGGEIICAPLKQLDAKITSGGTISYKGDPKVTQKISLGGTIEKL